MPTEEYIPGAPRSLSTTEAAVMAWLEAERQQSVTPDEVAAAFDWPRQSIRKVLYRLALKGWLRRTSRGRYETVLAETGGFAPPNPWAALSTWEQPYYVGFQSAAYELGLTPDRPGNVQTCVSSGARRPRGWHQTPIALIHLRSFSPEGATPTEVQGWLITLAGAEKILVEGATLQTRIGGVTGLARVLTGAAENLDWQQVARMGDAVARGHAGLRRLAALMEVLEMPIPEVLQNRAEIRKRSRLLPLGDTAEHGPEGPMLERWGVIDNVGQPTLLEELRR